MHVLNPGPCRNAWCQNLGRCWSMGRFRDLKKEIWKAGWLWFSFDTYQAQGRGITRKLQVSGRWRWDAMRAMGGEWVTQSPCLCFSRWKWVYWWSLPLAWGLWCWHCLQCSFCEVRRLEPGEMGPFRSEGARGKPRSRLFLLPGLLFFLMQRERWQANSLSIRG